MSDTVIRFVLMRILTPPKICHPERSVAQSKDLRFVRTSTISLLRDLALRLVGRIINLSLEALEQTRKERL